MRKTKEILSKDLILRVLHVHCQEPSHLVVHLLDCRVFDLDECGDQLTIKSVFLDGEDDRQDIPLFDACLDKELFELVKNQIGWLNEIHRKNDLTLDTTFEEQLCFICSAAIILKQIEILESGEDIFPLVEGHPLSLSVEDWNRVQAADLKRIFEVVRPKHIDRFDLSYTYMTFPPGYNDSSTGKWFTELKIDEDYRPIRKRDHVGVKINGSTASLNDKEYPLKKNEARAIQFLVNKAKEGHAEVRKSEVQKELGISRYADIFQTEERKTIKDILIEEVGKQIVRIR